MRFERTRTLYNKDELSVELKTSLSCLVVNELRHALSGLFQSSENGFKGFYMWSGFIVDVYVFFKLI